MGLYIKGMQLPEIKPNSSIKMELRNIDGEITIGIKTGGYSCCEQWTHYPIAEISTPHGILIDANKWHKKLQKQAMRLYGKNNKTYQLIMDIMDAIHTEPPVIESED